MNVLNKVTIQTMKKNRVRTIVTIIGIILSTAMFTAVTTIISSLLGYFHEVEVYESGDYHFHAIKVSGAKVAEAVRDPRLEKDSMLENIGYAPVDSVNVDKPYVCVFAANDTFFESMPVHLTDGRLPLTGNEVILPEHLAANGGVNASIGDVIELNIGRRAGAGEFEGVTFNQYNSYQYENEVFVGESVQQYAVVGFYSRPDFENYSAPGYTVLTRMGGEIDDEKTYECYFRVHNLKNNLNAFIKDHSLYENGGDAHYALLAFEGYSQYDNIMGVMTSFAVILCVLIFMGSVSLIYSAFSISVSERTKQFGLLSSVGATRRQIRRSVLTEALTLSAVGIPIGIISGIGGIAVTLFFLKDKFASFYGTNELPMHVTVTWQAILIAAVIAFVTVLVSAWIPSLRAMRISPIEAIRQSRDVKAKAKSANCSRLFTKLFGAEGVLARKYYSRSSKKYRATIISLAMSVILFVAASGFCMYMTKSVNAVDNRSTYDVVFGEIDREKFDRIRPEISELVNDLTAYISAGDDETQTYAYIPEADMTSEYRDYLTMTHEDGKAVYFNPNLNVAYMDDAAFRRLLAENGLDESDYFEEGNKAVAINHRSVPVYTQKTRENYVFDILKKGTDSIMISKPIIEPDGCHTELYWTGDRYGEGELMAYYVDNRVEYEYDSHYRPIGAKTELLEFNEIKLGALLNDVPTGMQSGEWIDIIYPMSAYNGASKTVNLYFYSDNTEKAIEEVKEIMQSEGITVTDRSYYDTTEDNRLMNNIVTIIKVFSYGFIALISLISVANVFNTVTTNVALRRRDYAMLRSIGMTKKGMNRMTNYECLIYGSRSLLVGLPISIGITYLIHRAVNDAAHMRFELPWTAIAIAVASVFIVVSVSMIYSTGKLKNDNPIDALKNENI